MRPILIVVFLFCLFSCVQTPGPKSENETLSPLTKGYVPQTCEELWIGFDPTKEPLDIEILHKWEEDNVICKIVRFRIGVFKGKKSMMAAIYGYPKGASKLPGLVQIHGGGQYADYRAVLTNAKRGYATISLAWAGRIESPGYMVNPKTVKLFWENKTNDPDYKVTTDWGVVDGYHDPCRYPANGFGNLAPAAWTLDSVKSPRNNPWFLNALGARRALTFLEHQPEVDAKKLGVYGHSMGGKLTVMTAADPRVRAAAPSCGGISDRYSNDTLYRAAIGDEFYLKQISCPIIFLSPSNDFHGRINDLQKAVREIQSKEWHFSCSPHHNHEDTPEYQTTGLLWFDQYLKGTFTFPKIPASSVELKTSGNVPLITVIPDASKPILSVDIYYTWQGQNEEDKDVIENTMNRFWHHARAIQNGNQWSAALPLLTTDKPLWVYSNITYPLDKPVVGAGYYYAYYTADKFTISSAMHMITSGQLKEAGVKATLKPSRVIETFEAGWQKEWFTFDQTCNWARRTHKLHDEQWMAPSSNALLSLEVLSKRDNKLQLKLDKYSTIVEIKGKSVWQEITLKPSDFKLKDDRLPSWRAFGEFAIAPVKIVSPKQKEGSEANGWTGEEPGFRNLRWKL